VVRRPGSWSPSTGSGQANNRVPKRSLGTRITACRSADLLLVPNLQIVLVPNLQIGNHESEAPASRDRKLELPIPNSQAGETVKVSKVQTDFKPSSVAFFGNYGELPLIFTQIRSTPVIFYAYPTFLSVFPGLRAQ